VLGPRYIVYGEWLYAKHTIFYDALPHWFLEFDVLDTVDGAFLSTECRRALLEGLPLVSVPVLREGPVRDIGELRALIGPSRFKSPYWRGRLDSRCTELRLDPARVHAETDPSDLMEGCISRSRSPAGWWSGLSWSATTSW
jgi:hypothetical protein